MHEVTRSAGLLAPVPLGEPLLVTPHTRLLEAETQTACADTEFQMI